MNCRSGDLAIIVYADLGWADNCVGQIRRLTTSTRTQYGNLGWRYEGDELRTNDGKNVIQILNDTYLQPIRGSNIIEQSQKEQNELVGSF